jgi:hypothetical protein
MNVVLKINMKLRLSLCSEIQSLTNPQYLSTYKATSLSPDNPMKKAMIPVLHCCVTIQTKTQWLKDNHHFIISHHFAFWATLSWKAGMASLFFLFR